MSMLFGNRSVATYLTADGLERQTGLGKEHFAIFVLKELTDNAIDACEQKRSPRVSVELSQEGGSIRITVRDNGEGWSDDDIKLIQQAFTIVPSTKFYRKTLNRGALGNAWACILGIAYATLGDQATVHACISSRRGSAKLTVKYNPLLDVVEVDAASVKKTPSTEVTIWLAPPKDLDFLSRYLRGLMKEYSLLNPHVSLNVSCVVAGNKWKDSVKASRGRANEKSTKSSILCYTPKEFVGFVSAKLRRFDSSSAQMTIADFARDEFLDVNLHGIPKKIADTRLSLKSSDRIYQLAYRTIKSATKKEILAPKGLLSKAVFKRVVANIYGKPTETPRFQEFSEELELDGVKIPLLFQVGVAHIPALRRRVEIWGINSSPKLLNPFISLSTQRVAEEDSFEWDKLLSKNWIGDDKPVLIMAHLLSPNLRYRDQSKNHLDLTSIGGMLTHHFDDVCHIYRKWHRKSLGLRRAGPVRILLRNELRDRLEILTTSGAIPQEEILPEQALWYKLRKQLAEMGEMVLKDSEKMRRMREQFPEQVVNEAAKLGKTREELGIYAAARAEQYFRGSVNSISWQAISNLAGLASDVILVEKEGIAEALAPYAARRGIALINSRGYASHYATDLMQRAREEGANVFLLTDLDLHGLVISSNQLNVPRIGVDDELLDSLSLSREELSEQYSLSRADSTKLWTLPSELCSPELKQFLSTRRIELDSILGTVGAKRMWDALERRILLFAPIRNLGRSLDPKITIRSIEQKMDQIRGWVETLGRPVREDMKSRRKLAEFRGFYNEGSIEDLETNLQSDIEKELMATDTIMRIDSGLKAVVEKLAEDEKRHSKGNLPAKADSR